MCSHGVGETFRRIGATKDDQVELADSDGWDVRRGTREEVMLQLRVCDRVILFEATDGQTELAKETITTHFWQEVEKVAIRAHIFAS
jgi:hypothetical protein